MLHRLGRVWRKLFPAKKQLQGAALYLDVAQTIEDFVEGRSGAWDWDDFVCRSKSEDDYLEAIRMEMLQLQDRYPAASGAYCSAAGLEAMRTTVLQLRKSAVQQDHN